MEMKFDKISSVIELAKLIKVLPSSITRAFYNNKLPTPKDVLCKMKLRYALHLMQHTSQYLKEISASCGFNNYKSFAKYITNVLAESPTDVYTTAKINGIDTYLKRLSAK